MMLILGTSLYDRANPMGKMFCNVLLILAEYETAYTTMYS